MTRHLCLRSPFEGGHLNVATVLFDLDGTLVDTVDDVSSALNRALSRMRLSHLPIEIVRAHLGFGGTALARAGIINAGLEPSVDTVSELHGLYLAAYREIPVSATKFYSGIPEVLSFLKKNNVSLGICTNKVSDVTHSVLKHLQAQDMFNIVVCGDRLANKKPAPDQILYALHELGATAASAVLIGDTNVEAEEGS